MLLGTYCQPTLGAVSGPEGGEVQCYDGPWRLLDERVGLAGASGSQNTRAVCHGRSQWLRSKLCLTRPPALLLWGRGAFFLYVTVPPPVKHGGHEVVLPRVGAFGHEKTFTG